MRKYLTCAIGTVSVENLSKRKFEALALHCKSFAKLDYLLWHKSYSWLLLLLSWRKILAQKWKYLKISERFSQPFLISSLLLSLSLCLPLSLPLRGITTRNIQFIQLCEIVSDGKLNQKLLVTSFQKVALCSNNDFAKGL